jgi:hypothetical protein
MTKPTQLERAVELHTRMGTLRRKAEALALELMRHPDATPEQLATAHRVCIAANAEYIRLSAACSAKWPPVASGWSKHPWDKE